MRRGGFLLTVNSDDAEAAQVHAVLEGSSAVDMVEREQTLKSEGYVAPVPAAPIMAAPVSPPSEGDTLEVVEERLRVGVRQVDRGGVRVRAYVVETPVQQTVTLRDETVELERHALNTSAADTANLFEGRVIELTETVEDVVVGKETRVVEEITVHKQAGERVEIVNDTVRHTEVEVEQVAVPPQVNR